MTYWKVSFAAAAALICVMAILTPSIGYGIPYRAVTIANARVLTECILVYTQDHDAPPIAISDLTINGRYLEKLPKDAWGRPFVYVKESADVVTLTSLGADGKPGGWGSDADLIWRLHLKDASGKWADHNEPGWLEGPPEDGG